MSLISIVDIQGSVVNNSMITIPIKLKLLKGFHYVFAENI